LPIPFDNAARIVLLSLALIAPAAAQSQPSAGADTAAVLRQTIEREVAQQGMEGEIHAQFDTAQLTAQPACEQAEAFLGGTGKLRSRFSVGLRCLAPAQWTIYVPVNLSVQGKYPVAARPLPPNTVLSENDITLREGDLMRLPPGAALSSKDVLGRTTTQRIAAKQLFKHNTLQAPNFIQRGQTITLEIRGDGFSVTGEGTALQSGEPGAIIQARTASGQIVQGRVIDGQTILLTM
jgi:flagella basal body P-ring formation protein FlgA